MPKTEERYKEEVADLTHYEMSTEEREAYNFYTKRFNKARDQRSQPLEYFDDMTYEQDYLANRRAAITYLQKKKNEHDVRVNTPTTEKRLEVVWTQLVSMNLTPEIIAFDQEDTELVDLGNQMTEVVLRTNQIEQDEDKMNDAIFELLSQRAVFVEELHNERCEKRVISGLQMYLGDIYLPAYEFNKQPYILKYERMTYEQAKGIYGDKDNWQYVQKGMGSADHYSGAFNYRLNTITEDEVEIIHYFSYPDDDYQVMINGVLMEEPGTKLPWRYEGYNITMSVIKPIINFAYGKGLVSSAKTLQALDNETLRNLIFKFRQALQPPTGVTAGRIYSKDIWAPGAMVQGVSKKNFESLIDHQGVTSSEMSMYQMIENKTNEFIGTAILQQQVNPNVSATQIIEEQKQAIKLLGQSIFGVMRLVRNLTFLRIYNILENETKAIGKKQNNFTKKVENIYRKYTIIDGTIENGLTGKKVIIFGDRPLEQAEKEDLYQYENEMSSKLGTPFRVKVINSKKLKELKLNWFVAIITKQKDSSQLAQVMFQDKINQASRVAQLVQRPLNADNVIEDFEKTWKAKDLFQKQAPSQMNQPQEPVTATPEAENLRKSIPGISEPSIFKSSQTPEQQVASTMNKMV